MMRNRYRHSVWWERDFAVALVVATCLHIAFFTVWGMMPKRQSVSLPVHVLNIKLGGETEMSDARIIAKTSPPVGNVQAIEASLAKQFAPVEPKRPATKPERAMTPDKQAALEKARQAKAAAAEKKQALQEAKQNVPVVAQQYVREREPVPQMAAQGEGEALGNDPKAKEKAVRGYTQTIALWIEKFKVYPAQARQQGMEGTAMVRIRIDRRGNIHYRIISKRTPYPLLDKAVLDMVRRADPVPPVPSEYPVKEEFLEFVVPVVFKLDR